MTPNPMKNQAFRPQNPQSGNVFFVIFLGIALFAALTLVVSKTMRSGVTNITTEQAKLAAGEMIAYGQQLRDTVKNLMITNGCSDTEITFEGATYYSKGVGYGNVTAPTSKKCHVFDTAGGNMKFITPAQTSVGNRVSLFIGVHCYAGQGTGPSPCPATAKELEFNVAMIPRTLCIEINRIAGIGVAGAEPPQDNYSATTGLGKFQGVYQSADNDNFWVQIGASGKSFGCYQDDTGSWSGQYIFYYILLAR